MADSTFAATSNEYKLWAFRRCHGPLVVVRARPEITKSKEIVIDLCKQYIILATLGLEKLASFAIASCDRRHRSGSAGNACRRPKFDSHNACQRSIEHSGWTWQLYKHEETLLVKRSD